MFVGHHVILAARFFLSEVKSLSQGYIANIASYNVHVSRYVSSIKHAVFNVRKLKLVSFVFYGHLYCCQSFCFLFGDLVLYYSYRTNISKCT